MGTRFISFYILAIIKLKVNTVVVLFYLSMHWNICQEKKKKKQRNKEKKPEYIYLKKRHPIVTNVSSIQQ